MRRAACVCVYARTRVRIQSWLRRLGASTACGFFPAVCFFVFRGSQPRAFPTGGSCARGRGRAREQGARLQVRWSPLQPPPARTLAHTPLSPRAFRKLFTLNVYFTCSIYVFIYARGKQLTSYAGGCRPTMTVAPMYILYVLLRCTWTTGPHEPARKSNAAAAVNARPIPRTSCERTMCVTTILLLCSLAGVPRQMFWREWVFETDRESASTSGKEKISPIDAGPTTRFVSKHS